MLETCKLKPWWGPPIATGNMNILQMWNRYGILGCLNQSTIYIYIHVKAYIYMKLVLGYTLGYTLFFFFDFFHSLTVSQIIYIFFTWPWLGRYGFLGYGLNSMLGLMTAMYVCDIGWTPSLFALLYKVSFWLILVGMGPALRYMFLLNFVLAVFTMKIFILYTRV